jgi:hypothetical protein
MSGCMDKLEITFLKVPPQCYSASRVTAAQDIESPGTTPPKPNWSNVPELTGELCHVDALFES